MSETLNLDELTSDIVPDRACPECGAGIRVVYYDDGDGRWDILHKCTNCTWEEWQ